MPRLVSHHREQVHRLVPVRIAGCGVPGLGLVEPDHPVDTPVQLPRQDSLATADTQHTSRHTLVADGPQVTDPDVDDL